MKNYYITDKWNYAVIEDDKMITYLDTNSQLTQSNDEKEIKWAKENLWAVPIEVEKVIDELYNKVKDITLVEEVEGMKFYLNKKDYKFYALVWDKYIELDKMDKKAGLIESKKKLKDFLKWIRKSKENYKFGDRVLLYWPTGTWKTYNFIEFLKTAKVKYNIIPVTEWMEDIDFFNRIIPWATWVEYKQKAICDMLALAEKGEKICIIFDELNRGSNSFMNLVLKAIDPVDWKNYYLTDVIQDRTYVIPQENIIFWATVNLGWKYTWVNSLDEALLDRFNLINYVGYNPDVEKNIIKAWTSDKVLAKKIFDFVKEIRGYHKDWEIRAPISTRWVKVLMEEYINCWNLKEAFTKTLLFRLVWVDDYGNPNTEEMEIVTQKFNKIFD